MKSKLIKHIFHTLYFTVLVLIVVFGYNYTLERIFSKDFLYRDVFEILLVTTVTYLYYYKVYTKDIFKSRKFLWLLVGLLVFLIAAVNKTVIGYNEPIVNALPELAQYIGFGTILFFILLLLDNFEAIINEKLFATKKALKEAENKLLRQQFNPHFLFNAFNSLYSLSLQNNPKTPDTILKLSGMMRYITDDATVSKVKLNRELQFIKDYIAIEKIRFGEKANISFEINGNAGHKTIEPLLLITLVENAFKHGFYTNETNAFVSMNATIKDNHLLFTVENSIQNQQHFNKKERQGKGLEILKKRLELSYPKKHDLMLKNENNIFLAQFKLAIE